MKKILVPFDFSTPAVNALRFAIDIAQRTKSSIHLITIAELPIVHDSLLAPVHQFENNFVGELQKKGNAELQKLIDRYKPNDVEINFTLKAGRMPESVLLFAETNKIDTIIVGSHGATGLREFFIGSNAEKIVRHSKVPVFVIKNYHEQGIKNIVLQLQKENDDDEDLVLKIHALQAVYRATLHIVFINTPTNFHPDNITHARLTNWAFSHLFENFTINIFNSFDEADGIAEFANAVHADIIAVINAPRKGLGPLMAKSLAEIEVNHSERIVWAYPAI